MRIHLIAIGGSAMHNLAIALAKKGFEITGSDDAVYEPSKTRLERAGLLPAKMGWFPENITAGLDAVILGMHARADNPELIRAQELGTRIYSYPEYIYSQAKDKTRVVIGGSHGKTTITSMILHVLNECGRDVDYLVGAQLKGFYTMVKITDDAPVMVIEGDEYLASPIDRRPKFHLYHADIAVISGIAWDHINVFPTFESYREQFRIFLDTIEENGTVIYCAEDAEVQKVISESKNELIRIPYNTPPYTVRSGKTFLETGEGQIGLEVFGKHNLLNLMAAMHVCTALKVSEPDFYQAISSFTGAAKRLEVLGSNSDTVVFKDFAHSPSKLRATVEAVKEQYPDRSLTAVIELHTFSSLDKSFLEEYKGSMELADQAVVFIDKHTFEQKKIDPFDESEVKDAFGEARVKFFNSAETLESFLSSINYKCNNLLMMSSGNFGGLNLPKLAAQILKN